MSRKHIVQPNEVLAQISTKYYGVPNKYNLIIKANPQLSGRGKAVDGTPFIHKGEVLIIPDEIENKTNPIQEKKPPESIKNVSNDAISILIDDKLFSFWTEYTINFEIDTFDTFSFSVPFDRSLLIYRESFRPFSYKNVAIYYGQELIFTGYLLSDSITLEPDERSISIEGYSLPAFLNDCHMPLSSFPLEFNNLKLEQITGIVCKPYGIQYRFLNSSGSSFEKVSIDLETGIFNFLSDLANQKELLISNNEKGELILWRSQKGNPISTFKQGNTPFISCTPNFDPQNFYSHITGISQTTENEISKSYTYKNNYLINKGIMRNFNFVVKDVKSSDIKKATLTKAGRMFGESVSYDLLIQGHRDEKGNLLKKNTIVSVQAPDAMIYSEFNFLVKSLTMNRTTEGDTTEMNIVLPGIYSGEIQEVFPWEE